METPTPESAARDWSASEFKTAFPPQFTILGVRLLPLSLGRYRLLKWANVAFVADGEASAGADDLFTGIVICGMPCADFRSLLNTGRLERHLQKWGKRLGRQIRRERGFNLFEKMGLFQNYITEAQELPWVALPVQGGEVPEYSNTHWSLNMEVILRGNLGWSLDEVEEAPLTKALADYFQFMESSGAVRLMPANLYREMISEGQRNADVLLKMEEAMKNKG
jgi:hypothetical protein